MLLKMGVKLLSLITLVCLATAVTSRKGSFLAGRASTPRAQVDPKNCFFDTQITCYSCKSKAVCIDTTDGMTAYGELCPIFGEVCNIAQGEVEATCSGTPANDEPGSECFCNPSLTQPRTEADVYTDQAYLLCDNDETLYYSCLSDYYYSSRLEVCTPLPPTCVNIGIFSFPDDCDFYYRCGQVGVQGTVEMCSEGNFFDPNVDRCEPEPDIVVACFDSGDPITGLIRSVQYCSVFYVCDEGLFISSETCEDGFIFSEDDQGCIVDDGSCLDVDYCFSD